MNSVQWRNLLVAGVAGLTCGKVYSLYHQNKPAVVRPIVHCSFLSGAGGAVLGLAVSSFRRLPSHIYALSVGANFALATGAFLSLRHVMMSSLQQRQPQVSDHLHHTQEAAAEVLYSDPTGTHLQYLTSGGSGGLTGALASLLSRHALKPTVLTSVSGVFLGITVQYLYDKFAVWRRKKAIEIHYPELAEPSNKTKWSLEQMQTRFLEFWNRSSKSAEVNVDNEILKSAIAEEKAVIAHLDSLLNDEDENNDSNVSLHNSTQIEIERTNH